MEKRYEIWVSWQPDGPAYIAKDFEELIAVFSGAVKMIQGAEQVEVRLAAAPVEA